MDDPRTPEEKLRELEEATQAAAAEISARGPLNGEARKLRLPARRRSS
jgi:hypothetical protein